MKPLQEHTREALIALEPEALHHMARRSATGLVIHRIIMGRCLLALQATGRYQDFGCSGRSEAFGLERSWASPEGSEACGPERGAGLRPEMGARLRLGKGAGLRFATARVFEILDAARRNPGAASPLGGRPRAPSPRSSTRNRG